MLHRGIVAALAAIAGIGVAQAQEDLVAAGEKVFKKCAACHAVGEGAANKVGPQLNDLFGRTAGTAEGYSYSKAMTEAGAGGLVWKDETLAQFLADPKAVVKGTKMAFPGLKKEEDVNAVLAYLKTFDTDGMPEEGAAPKSGG